MASARRAFLRWCLLLMAAAILPHAHAQDIVVVTVHATLPAATVRATPSIPSPASYTSLDDFKETVLKISNDYRRTHDAGPLSWNESLVQYSRKWADTCLWKHSHGPYGENLAFGYPNASAAVAAWGDEGELYNFQKPTGFTEETGHFTQLVWKSTVEVGCAAVNCGYTEHHQVRREEGHDTELDSRNTDGVQRAQGWYVVCEYTPAGNVVGRDNDFFKLNVMPGNLSVTTSTTSTAAPTSQTSESATAKMGSDSTLPMMFLVLGTVGIGMSLYT
ncbi:hypothetical protein N7492_001948 [Penicillium capsulatum]|uniref:SCP domain-containing protein n=1 Tax=Penicillium capsulatum TaxID=69766 RepID=A0A9W9IGN4_9EURO|nr:hypothetical protein N7492_001948 [Penicillium capsulatum]